MTRTRRSHLYLYPRTGKLWRGFVFLLAGVLLALAAIGPLAVQPGRSAASFLVNSTLDEADAVPGDGICSSTPSGACTLRAAVQEANALAGDDTIVLPPGNYLLTISGAGEDLAASGDLDITANLVVQGAGAPGTIIDATALDRVLQIFSPAQVTISGVTLKNGDSGATAGGGIALASGSTLTMQEAAVSANSAGAGGGIYNNGAVLVLQRVLVADNNAATAAGIHNAGNLSLYDSTIRGNHATTYGGGLLNTSTLTLDGVTVSSNIADTNGGGLYLHSADPATGLVTIMNSSISGNQAKNYQGGGIWVYYQTELSVTNSTIADNSAGQGGGIFNYHQQAIPTDPDAGVDAVLAGNIQFDNTLIANNTFANCGRSDQTEAIFSLGHNLDSGNTCEFAGTGDLVNTDPQLGLLQDNGGPTHTHVLLTDSPAKDQVLDDVCPSIDQRGVARPQDAHCDIGAYEVFSGLQADLALTKSDAVDPLAVGNPLTYTLSIHNNGPDLSENVILTDTLPLGVSFSDAAPDQGSCGQANGVVSCNLGDIASGDSVVVEIHTRADGSGTLANQARVSADTFDPAWDNNKALEYTTVLSGGSADLSLRKVDVVDPVTVGDPISYSLTISNTGPETALSVVVSDTLPSSLQFVSAVADQGSCGQAAGLVTCNLGDILNGNNVSITLVTNTTQAGVVTNTASVSANTFDPDLANNAASATTTVESMDKLIYLPLVMR